MYTSTTKCHVSTMWPYSTCHTHAQHLMQCYSWRLSQSKSSDDNYLINYNDIYSLQFDRLQFDHTEAILLTSLVEGNSKKLEIVRSEISDNAAIVLSDFLQTNKMLQELEFSQNTISGENMEQIVKAIQANITLQILDISSNNISDG